MAEKKLREHKGTSVVAEIDSFCVVDIETTGQSPRYAAIVEVAAIRYENGRPVESFSSLIRPDDYDALRRRRGFCVNAFIRRLTGIDDEMLRDAPPADLVVPEFQRFLGNATILGHNVNFDVNFLYDEFMRRIRRPLRNDFIDTLRIARRVHPEWPRHRLQDLVTHYGLDYSNAHRALVDCRLAAACYRKMIEETRRVYGKTIMDLFPKRKKKTSNAKLSHNDGLQNEATSLFDFIGPACE